MMDSRNHGQDVVDFGRGTNTMYKIKLAITKWEKSRRATISSLRQSAEVLKQSHRKNAEEEHVSAKASLVGDFVGLGGLLLAPVSGGLSLVAVAGSSVVGIGSFINKWDANKKDENTIREVKREVERALEQDKRATDILSNMTENVKILEKQFYLMGIDNLILSLEQTSVINIKTKAEEIRSCSFQNQLQQRDDMVSIPGLDLSKQMANLNAALNSAEQIVKCTTITKEVYRGTRTIKQMVSTAQSVNKVTQAAKSLATAKEAAVVTAQASKSMVKSTAAFANVARGADGVVKTAGVVSSTAKSARVAVDIVTASGQAASAAKSVTNAAKIGEVISSATKGADTTIKTVKNVKQVSNTVKTVTQVANDSGKAIRTTRITTNAARVSKVTETATKAASISKVGLAINAVVIPLDIYNFIQSNGNLNQSYEDVKEIEKFADSLEKEIEETTKNIEVQCECITQLHVQLCKIYKDHKIEILYKFLQLMSEKLEFHVPF